MKSTTVRMADTLLRRVDGIAESLNRPRSWIINQALERFVDYEEWYIQEVESGLAELNRGEVAADKEVVDRFKKWGVDAS